MSVSAWVTSRYWRYDLLSYFGLILKRVIIDLSVLMPYATYLAKLQTINKKMQVKSVRCPW